MKGDKLLLKYVLILLLPAGILLNYISITSKMVTERIYSNFAYKFISQILSTITGIFSFSLAELLLILFILLILWYLIVLCARVVKRSSSKREVIKEAAVNALALAGIIYFSFIILWGLNYNRATAAQIFNLDTRPASVNELAAVCEDLISRANSLRDKVDENSDGIMYPRNGIRDVLTRAPKGYEAAAKVYPELDGKYGPPKGIMLSRFMAYTGIWGIYSAFTAEANVNMSIPTPSLPSTTCHEMAHQRGFAREDEANYIAYLTSSMHPDYDFQYSGVLLALLNAMNALYDTNQEMYKSLRDTYDEGVNRDIKAIAQYNKLHEGPVEQYFSKGNDLYLKANNQKEGELSYGRVVDLLIAEYRAKPKEGK